MTGVQVADQREEPGLAEALRRMKRFDVEESTPYNGTDMRILNLACLGLRSVPEQLFSCSGFEWLDLCGNQLTALPSEIGRLSNLRTLDLSDNQLTALPPEIGRLSNLFRLLVSDNQLTAVPSEIGELSKLVDLRLAENQLRALPSEIGRLRNLRVFTIDGNELTAIDGFIAHAMVDEHVEAMNLLHEIEVADRDALMSALDEMQEQGLELYAGTAPRLDAVLRVIVDDGGLANTEMIKVIKWLGKFGTAQSIPALRTHSDMFFDPMGLMLAARAAIAAIQARNRDAEGRLAVVDDEAIRGGLSETEE